MSWVAEHWEELMAALSGLWVVVSVVVSLTPTKEDDKWLRKATEWVSFMTSKNRPGVLKTPLSPMPEGNE